MSDDFENTLDQVEKSVAELLAAVRELHAARTGTVLQTRGTTDLHKVLLKFLEDRKGHR